MPPPSSSDRDKDRPDLARQVDAAQSIVATAAADDARRIEKAYAEANRGVAMAMARQGASAGTLDVAGGVAVFAGTGSPMTQGLACGLDGPVGAADLDALEAFLCRDGNRTRQLELCPFADATLPALLAARGYRVNEWQLGWSRQLADEIFAPPPPGVTVRLVRPGEEERFYRVVLAGFLELADPGDVSADALTLFLPMAAADQQEKYFALLGDEAIGGATLGWASGVAFVNGSGVLPGYRRRGAQGALIRVRLARAIALGCDVAVSFTLPGTASRRNMERHGFHATYPKVVMLADG